MYRLINFTTLLRAITCQVQGVVILRVCDVFPEPVIIGAPEAKSHVPAAFRCFFDT